VDVDVVVNVAIIAMLSETALSNPNPVVNG
jgi:hypothetical protein